MRCSPNRKIRKLAAVIIKLRYETMSLTFARSSIDLNASTDRFSFAISYKTKISHISRTFDDWSLRCFNVRRCMYVAYSVYTQTATAAISTMRWLGVIEEPILPPFLFFPSHERNDIPLVFSIAINTKVPSMNDRFVFSWERHAVMHFLAESDQPFQIKFPKRIQSLSMVYVFYSWSRYRTTFVRYLSWIYLFRYVTNNLVIPLSNF